MRRGETPLKVILQRLTPTYTALVMFSLLNPVSERSAQRAFPAVSSSDEVKCVARLVNSECNHGLATRWHGMTFRWYVCNQRPVCLQLESAVISSSGSRKSAAVSSRRHLRLAFTTTVVLVPIASYVPIVCCKSLLKSRPLNVRARGNSIAFSPTARSGGEA